MPLFDQVEITNLPGMPNIKISISKGWYKLVVAAAKILHLIFGDHHHIKIETTKEKFGGLRIYPIGSTHEDDRIHDDVYDILEMIEYHSTFMCEECGDYAKMYTFKMLVKTVCEKHKIQLMEQLNVKSEDVKPTDRKLYGY